MIEASNICSLGFKSRPAVDFVRFAGRNGLDDSSRLAMFQSLVKREYPCDDQVKVRGVREVELLELNDINWYASWLKPDANE